MTWHDVTCDDGRGDWASMLMMRWYDRGWWIGCNVKGVKWAAEIQQCKGWMVNVEDTGMSWEV